MTPSQVVDTIFASFARNGGRHYGENVTELEHALQSAEFAERAGEPPALVAACLLHDYGHLLHNMGEDIAERGVNARHEDLGAHALKRWFPPEVVEPARLHVAAKRYLCWKRPAYLSGLSEASRQSLALQGGPMSDMEGAEFEQNPHCSAAARLRRYDDLGKIKGMRTAELEEYRTLLESLVVLAPNSRENGSGVWKQL